MQPTRLVVLSVSHLCKSLCTSLVREHTDLYSPFIADRWGRKLPIVMGCVLMIFGGLLGAFCKNYGSMLTYML
jgi:MFS family permease